MVEKFRIFSNMISIVHDACTNVYRGRAYYIETHVLHAVFTVFPGLGSLNLVDSYWFSQYCIAPGGRFW